MARLGNRTDAERPGNYRIYYKIRVIRIIQDSDNKVLEL